jgi:hypothetical protein
MARYRVILRNRAALTSARLAPCEQGSHFIVTLRATFPIVRSPPELTRLESSPDRIMLAREPGQLTSCSIRLFEMVIHACRGEKPPGLMSPNIPRLRHISKCVTRSIGAPCFRLMKSPAITVLMKALTWQPYWHPCCRPATGACRAYGRACAQEGRSQPPNRRRLLHHRVVSSNLAALLEPTHVRLWRRNATLNHKPPHIWRDSWSLVGQLSILDVLEDQDGTCPTYKSLAV